MVNCDGVARKPVTERNRLPILATIKVGFKEWEADSAPSYRKHKDQTLQTLQHLAKVED
jgi:hypothetical protein